MSTAGSGTSGQRPGEFELIERIVRSSAATVDDRVPVGPGDDAAVVTAPDGRVVVSTDLYVEGRHFRTDWSSAEDIGHRCVAAAVADIAAMGAAATCVVIGLGVPKDVDLGWLDGFTRGVTAECQTAGAALAGGDLTTSNVINVSVTALGDLQGRAAVLRSGARPGDVVAVAGLLGHAAAGLAILSRGFRAGKTYIDAHRRPEPPYGEGSRAASAGAHAMCDVSDGLVQDVGHIAAASGVSIDLDRAAFDVPPRMAEIASAIGADPMSWVLAGGDDHALVATFGAAADVPDGWRVVGTVGPTRPADDAPRVTVSGVPPTDLGWDHFR